MNDEARADAAASQLVADAVLKRMEVKRHEERVADLKRELADLEDRINEAWKTTDTDQARITVTDPETDDQYKVTVSLRGAAGVTVKKEDKPRLLEWLRSRGESNLIREDVPPSTLKSHVLELDESGVQVPEFVRIWRGRKLGYLQRKV